ncbi:MAG: ABC transporter ATP-binding protein [Candidatus Omnitrophica bacterium]|nr:ABC transporter ATP-binding protein [Candidatus Omnitrophota bacterium]
MNTILIELKNVSKSFYPPLAWRKILSFNFKNTPVCALENINLSLPGKSIIGVLGTNGAGKTTLLKIISTLILPDTGTVKINKYSTEHDDQKIKSIIGLVTTEERDFYWRLNGRQNLDFFSTMYGLNKKQAEGRINKLFKVFGVDYQDKRFDSYSTGMKRKFSLIRALLHNPGILLFDEPTKSLDYNTSLELLKYITILKQQGKTILFATHNITEAEQICDRFLVLNRGRILGFGTKEELGKRIHSDSATLTEIYLKLTGK